MQEDPWKRCVWMEKIRAGCSLQQNVEIYCLIHNLIVSLSILQPSFVEVHPTCSDKRMEF